MKLSNNKILITGGATGIGLGLTNRFADDNKVIICGRNLPALEKAAAGNPNITYHQADLSRADQRIALVEWLRKNHPDTNVLVNNAGIQNWMQVSDNDFFERTEQEIAINITAPIHLTRLFLEIPAFNTLINVTSGLSFVPMTKAPVYSATKAFLHSFTLSLRHLLRTKNIEVIELIPPALNTDLGGKGLHDFAPPVHEFIDAVFNQLESGSTTATFGFSEAMRNSGPAELMAAFERMNNPA